MNLPTPIKEEKQIQQGLSEAIDILYSVMNPESSFQSEDSKELRESIYRCIRKLEFWHDELHKINLT